MAATDLDPAPETVARLLEAVDAQASGEQPPGVRPETLRLVLAAHGRMTVTQVDAAIQAAVDAGDIEKIVVLEVSRVARSIRDLERTVDRFRDAGAELHIVEERLVVRPGEEDPYQRALFQMLGVFAELEAKIKRKNIAEGIAARQDSDEYHHGPAPLGFEKEDGRLLEGPEYDRVCVVLDAVARGEMSKRQASKELDTSRRTIQRAIEQRPELYGL